MATLASRPAPPLADSPLGRTISSTATDIWNDSCAVDELEYAISFGAVGATANPTIVADVWKHDPGYWRGRVAGARRRPTGRHRGGPRVGRGRGDVAACRATAPAGARGVRRTAGPPVDADRSDAVPVLRPDAGAGDRLRRPGAQHHREVPGHRGRGPRDGGGDLPGRQRQRHGLVQRRPGRRGRRGRRARTAATRGRGPAGRPDGPRHHADDGPPRGLAPGPDRARRHRRRPGGPAVVWRRGLQARVRRIPGPGPAGSSARRGDPPPPALVRADRGRRHHHDARGLAAALQRLVHRGPAADGRPRSTRGSWTSSGRGSPTSCAPSSPTA